ncbi:MAG: anaerobic ribonucleoside-triphosphate reductase activating protein [Desulfitobacteriaceae bacterium]|nr:anaerobic ribonucleoside-triphosphate reductase activating protein [Desulfitobacteriaceae bacterium]MDD4752668.1 anaerobic ribonucleoside-triphosphate reductase activating protein [Desulfitobacteriaceae bacterium]
MKIRIAGIVPESVVDGPGIRFVVFTQGCPHHCLECHNPETHDFHGGELKDVKEIINEFSGVRLVQGITISGGEPFCQAEACTQLAREVKLQNKNVLVYSGYTFEELQKLGEKQPEVKSLLGFTDILIDGRYIKEQRDLNLAFRGSANQRIIDVPKSLTVGQAVDLK